MSSVQITSRGKTFDIGSYEGLVSFINSKLSRTPCGEISDNKNNFIFLIPHDNGSGIKEAVCISKDYVRVLINESQGNEYVNFSNIIYGGKVNRQTLNNLLNQPDLSDTPYNGLLILITKDEDDVNLLSLHVVKKLLNKPDKGYQGPATKGRHPGI